MNENRFLESEHVYLRAIIEKDWPLITKWLNDPLVTLYLFYGQVPLTEAEATNLLLEQIKRGDIVLIIADKRNGTPIGFTGFHEIHTRSRKAEFRIFIGEKRFWDKGIGTEVTALMSYYGFDRLNLRRISLGFTEGNKGAGRAYEKAGYEKEGILREDIYRNSTYYNSVVMSMLRSEYYAKFHKKLERRFALGNLRKR